MLLSRLILVSLVVGILEGMSPLEAMTSVQGGLGGTLGSLTMIIIFGAILGKLMTDSGGAQRIATTLIQCIWEKESSISSCFNSFCCWDCIVF